MAELVENPSVPSRPTLWSRFLDALPLFLIALSFLVAGLSRVPILGFDGKGLVLFLQVEYVSLFWMIYLLPFALARQSPKESNRMIGLFLSLAVFVWAIYTVMKYGPWGPVVLLVSTFGKYWGLKRDWRDSNLVLSFLIRWLFSILLFCNLVFLLFKLSPSADQWKDEPVTHWAGFAYFIVLGMFEWFTYWIPGKPTKAGPRQWTA